MKHRKDWMAEAIPHEWCTVGHNGGAARTFPGNCAESSMDLMAGLEVVELPAQSEWAATVPVAMEPPDGKN